MSVRSKSKKVAVYTSSLLAIVLWGMSYIWNDRLLRLGIPVEYFVYVRVLMAGMMLLLYNIVVGHNIHIHRKDSFKFLALAACEPFIYFVCETYGIQPIAGCKTSKELSDIGRGWIVSQSLAEHFFGSAEAAINKELKAASYVGVDWHQPIVAVVNDVHVSEKDYNTWAVYAYNGEIRSGGSQNLVVLRLKPGVNPRRFAEEQNLNPWNYASDHYAVASFTAYDDIGSARNQFAAPTLSYDFNLQIATALFFLVNLCLGVIGTFWMQTKRRTEESGIMRAFGATRRRVMLMFLAEGWVMATVSMFIACVLYLNYVKLGLGELCISPHEPGTQPDPTWVADKPLHFLIISAVVYIIILCTVLIGTAIPAVKIVRARITEALREE